MEYQPISLLRQLFQDMNTEKVTIAETKMKELANNTEYLSLVYYILVNKQETQQVRTLSASFLNSQLTQKLTLQNSVSFSQVLVAIITSPEVKSLHKWIIQKSIIKCLQKSTQAQVQGWVSLVSACLNNQGFYQSALVVFSAIVSADIPINLIQKAVCQTYNLMLANIEIKVQNENMIIQLLRIWIAIVDRLKQYKTTREYLEVIISSPGFLKLIGSIYELHPAFKTDLELQNEFEPKTLMQWASQIHSKILKLQIKSLGGGLPSILKFTRNYLGKFANLLKTMVASQQNQRQSTNKRLIILFLSIIGLYIRFEPTSFTLSDAIPFQNHILFPLLIVDQDQIGLFQESPELFNEVVEDCVHKQILGSLKSEAAKLLQIMGDNVSGCLKYTLKKAVESINIRCNFIPNNGVKGSQVLQIQTAFLILSIFSYELKKYPEQISAIRKILSNNRIKYVGPLEMARIFSFLAYNYFLVFENPNQDEGWLDFAIKYKVHPTTRYCAFDFFSEVVQGQINQLILEKIGDQIENGNLVIIWQIFDKIIDLHYPKISQHDIVFLISKVFLRIQRQLRTWKNQVKYDSMDIINCLRVFVNILEQGLKEINQTKQRKQIIISSIWPILQFYSEAHTLDIQDEVVYVAIELLDSMQTLNPEMFRYANQFISVFKAPRCNYTDKTCFLFINQLILKAAYQNYQKEVIQAIIVVRDAVLNALSNLIDQENKKLKPISHYRLSLCNGLIVIQNAIAIFGTQLIQLGYQDLLKEISSSCMRILPSKDTQAVQSTPNGYIILSRALNTLFLCHLHLKVDQMPLYLRRLQDQKLYHEYDTKVLVMCIVKQVFQEADTASIVFWLTAACKIVKNSQAKDYLLQKHRKTSKISDKIRRQMKIVNDFDEIVELTDSPFKKDQDIPSILTQLFAEMKNRNRDTFDAVLTAFQPEIFDYFKSFINQGNIQRSKRVYVKVVGLKRNNPEVGRIEVDETIDDSDQEQSESRFKRTRTKLKAQDKKKKIIKLEKSKI